MSIMTININSEMVDGGNCFFKKLKNKFIISDFYLKLSQVFLRFILTQKCKAFLDLKMQPNLVFQASAEFIVTFFGIF
jgi:hypothetical protein